LFKLQDWEACLAFSCIISLGLSKQKKKKKQLCRELASVQKYSDCFGCRCFILDLASCSRIVLPFTVEEVKFLGMLLLSRNFLSS
jgi:hypothetical protein